MYYNMCVNACILQVVDDCVKVEFAYHTEAAHEKVGVVEKARLNGQMLELHASKLAHLCLPSECMHTRWHRMHTHESHIHTCIKNAQGGVEMTESEQQHTH